MFDQQMELSLHRGGECVCPSSYRRQRRHSRASWWFAQMRQAVDRALDWPAAAAPRAEQIWLGTEPMAVAGAPQFDSEERQVCT